MSYSNGIQTTHFFDGAALDTDAVLVGGENIPAIAGLTGRVTSITVYCTVALTTNPTIIEIGVAGGDQDGYAYLSVPASSVGTITTGVTAGALGNKIAADDAWQISSNGGAAAGDGDVLVTVEWS